ncbi:MAG: sigma-70 family RNA polymerase sigma factor [Steroidobacteraceae bacterium]
MARHGSPRAKNFTCRGPIPTLTRSLPLQTQNSDPGGASVLGRGLPHERLNDWFREWRQPLRRFLMHKTRFRADIDDISQEVYLRLLRYERSELVAHPKAYLYRIAANVAAEWATRACRRHPHDSRWLPGLADRSEPQLELERVSSQAEIGRAIESLPGRCREILRLHYSCNLSHRQIAEQLGITLRMVKRDMIRAYSLLRESLNPEHLEIYERFETPGDSFEELAP